MKKKVSMLLIGAMIVFAGCGSKDTAEVTDTASEIVEEAADQAEEASEGVEDVAKEMAAETEEIADEASATAAEVVTPEHEPVDISDCATFTDIVNKLQPGQGYANISVDGADLFAVTDYTYECDMEGSIGTTEADLYRYNGDKIEYLGYVYSGGTAYPLMIYDNKIYTAGNHYVKAYEVEDKGLEAEDEVYVNFDTDGNATYYKSEDGKDVVIAESDEDVVEMYDFIDKGEVIIFDTIK